MTRFHLNEPCRSQPDKLMKYPNRNPITLLSFAALVFCICNASRLYAGTAYWFGTNGVSATTNWSDQLNWSGTAPGGYSAYTPLNNAANFNWNTKATTPSKVTVHVDGALGTPGSGNGSAWSLVFGTTNGYQTVLIDPNIQLHVESGSSPGSGLYVAPQGFGNGSGGNTVNSGPYTNYATIMGGGVFSLNGQFEIEAGASSVENHYSILDMSGLNTFIQTNSNGGTSASRFLLLNGSTRGQAIVYLATNNYIYPNADIQVGWLGGTYSNSLPVGLYLGMTNVIFTGPNGNGNQLVVGIDGITNALMTFNPKFLGGATKPTAYLSGNGSGASGMMNWVAIGQAGGSHVPANAVVDFTGGNVTWLINSLHLGRSGDTTYGSTGRQAAGTLTFDNGLISILGGDVGEQTASGGSPCFGTVNVGTNATFLDAGTLYVPFITGTPNLSSSGTINVNGGTFGVNTVIDTNNLGTINLTNATLSFTNVVEGNIASTTNIVIGHFNTGGSTNHIVIASFSAPPTGFPFTNKLISYFGSIGGAGFNFDLTMPAATPAYVATLVNNTNNNRIDLIVTGGPAPARILTWTGTDSSNPQNWDIGTSFNWRTNGGPATTYNQLDFVTFDDTASSSTVNLTTTLTPSTLLVTNNSLTYTFNGSGSLSGAIVGGLNKQGSGALILDESPNDNFTGGVNIGGGTLQIGNNDGNGSLGNLQSTIITNNGALVFDRNNSSLVISNVISGAGTVANNGSGTVTFAAANTISAVSVNAGTLKLGNNQALGTGNTTTVAANSTLDLNGFTALHNNSLVAQGSGSSGQGAIDNSSVNTASPALTNITLTGNTTFGASQGRWDLRSPGGTTGNPATSTLSTSGNAYNLNKVGSQFFGLVSTTVDPALGNVDVQGGTFDFEGNTTGLGDPTKTLTVENGATLEFWSATNQLNKQIQLNDGAIVLSGNGNNMIAGPMTLNGNENLNVISGSSLTLNGSVTGSGSLNKNGTNVLTLNGADNHSGGTTVNDGTLILNDIGTAANTLTENISQTSSSVPVIVGGSGTNMGPVDIEDTLWPGVSGHSSTFGAGSGVDYPGSMGALAFGALGQGVPKVIFNLGSSTTAGNGVNDLINVNGDLDANFAQVKINPLATLNTNSDYTLINFTGTKNSNFSGIIQTVSPSRYNFTLHYLANAVTLTVSGGPVSLVWNNNAANGIWDVQNSQNWLNTSTAASDVFYNLDSVTLDDSITNAATPTTAINLTAAALPAVVNNNSTTNYTISGVGEISGSASITKNGTSTLTINTTNDFTGSVAVLGGVLKAASPNSLGATNGTVTITNGATLDINYALGLKPVIVSGVGSDGNGALVNNSANSVIDSSGGLANVTLAGDTTIGGSGRLDFGQTAPNSGTLKCLNGGNFNVTIYGQGNPYREWDNLNVDTNLANVSLVGNVSFGFKGASTLGNPTNTLFIGTNTFLQFYNDGSANPVLNKSVLIYGGGTMQNGGGTGVVLQPVTLGTNAADNCAFNIGGTSLTISNVISGPGNLVKFSNGSPLLLTATNTYTGNTVISNGAIFLVDNGSISSSAHITDNSTLDVSRRNNQTLTLASGQVLQGNGSVNGNVTVSANATISPGGTGTLGTLTITNIVTLSGMTIMDLNKSTATNDVIRGAANIQYGGTLAVTNLSGTLAAGDQFKLFNANTYNGAFSSITSANPNNDSTLAWDTSSLAVNGILKVVTGVLPTPHITGISLNGTTLTVTATNGADNESFVLLESTNVALPLSQWTPVLTNNYDGSGNLNLSTNVINPGNVQMFYLLQSQ